jgi:uncharacterized membrane protein
LEQVVSFLFKYKEAIFSKGQFSFGAHPSLLLILAIVLVMAGLIYFIYSKRLSQLSQISRALLMVLRVSLFGLILFCLMRPVIVVPSVLPQSSFVAVLMDDSASMKIPDENGQTRLQAVKNLMARDGQMFTSLSDKFKIRLFKFSNAAERAEDAAQLKGEGTETNLESSLEQVTRELAGVPLSGLVLVTDGAETRTGDLTALLGDLRSRGLPVFTVGAGQPALETDVELVRVMAARRVLVGSTVSAELQMRASGIKNRPVRIDLSEDGRLLRSDTVQLKGIDATEVVRVNFNPSTAGLHKYTFSVPPMDGELVTDNNSQEILIQVNDSHPRVLYVEGEPRWEYGKLRAAMAEEKNVLLVSLLRSAEGKFYRQGIDTPDELTAGFPKTEEELFKFDAVILGNIEATFFAFEQLKNLEQFVSRRGGALLCLGGSKAFDPGGYANTPIADLSPVYLGGKPKAEGETQSFKARPSERGKDHPIVRLSSQPELNLKAWDDLPAITLPEVFTNLKPGASVILEAHSKLDKNLVVPLLVEERYGRGRTLALLASDTWRWRMMLETKNTSFEAFWKNLTRYLVESVGRPMEVATERTSYGDGEPVQIRATMMDRKFLSISDAEVHARVTAPSGKITEVNLTADLARGAEGYTAALVPDEEGIYKIEASARKTSRETDGRSAEASFLVGPINREAFGAAQNRDLLKRIAAETGGAYYPLAKSADLVDDLTHVEGTNSVRETRDLWDMPINFLLLVGLASAEWFIRKRKGLA